MIWYISRHIPNWFACAWEMMRLCIAMGWKYVCWLGYEAIWCNQTIFLEELQISWRNIFKDVGELERLASSLFYGCNSNGFFLLNFCLCDSHFHFRVFIEYLIRITYLSSAKSCVHHSLTILCILLMLLVWIKLLLLFDDWSRANFGF